MRGVEAIRQELKGSLPLITVMVKAKDIDAEDLISPDVQPTKLRVLEHYFCRRSRRNRANAKSLLENVSQ